MPEHMIELTFADHDENAFVPLITFGFPDKAALDAAWASIPQGPADSAYLADRHDPEGVTANREISVAWIESISGRSIEDLKTKGRAHNAALQVELAQRFAASASA